ncbi:carboxypeptidase-like regulatory domain-containing protein [Flavobacterium tibetense]|uniref:Carboxypeptidase-like regulatory domain-containing protein n=1 Tax=Flavobacterium tibetense TaxID=2233533 RepID=A0A365P531_9FLAO|nr:carboxypeptidase-like regulatory domain-containing protein [Flavobacterium tibetense]RBA29524.1 hypothetical protein DPN68_02435 [Flavobacterium tibetense]
MKKFLLFLLVANFCFSQKSEIKGKIISESTNLEGIHVINKTQNKGVVTTSGGYFTIHANEKDTLIFSAVHLEAVNHVVKKEDFSAELLFVKMNALVSPLEEVTMTKYKNITPEALGIIPIGMKTYTPAERRLKAASEMKTEMTVNAGNESGVSLSFDAIINSMSGRTRMLKKEFNVERKELLEQQIIQTFGKKYFIVKHKIPDDYVDSFILYLIDDANFEFAFLNENNLRMELILTQKSIDFLKLLNSN